MNDLERVLLQFVVDGDIRKAQIQAKAVLEGITAKKDERFRDNLLHRLNQKDLRTIELPYNLRDVLVAEDLTDFQTERFLLRDSEKAVVKKLLTARKVSEILEEKRIKYLPSVIFHGESGTGKTLLARYIAHLTDLPFVYINFSNLIASHLGDTQKNIGRCFEYARRTPCVLCFDEIDAVGIARGDSQDVSEMSRVVIALMQEIDRMPNQSVVIGTTNRVDRLDPALMRRFTIVHEILPMSEQDAFSLAEKFFAHAEASCTEDKIKEILASIEAANGCWPASRIIAACTECVAEEIAKSLEGGAEQ